MKELTVLSVEASDPYERVVESSDGPQSETFASDPDPLYEETATEQNNPTHGLAVKNNPTEQR